MRKNNKKIKFPDSFLELINGKNIIFQYQEDVAVMEILDGVIYDIHNYFHYPEICLCSEEKTVAMQAPDDDRAIIKVSRNLTSTMIKLEKLIFKNKCVVFTGKLEEIISSANKRSKTLFLETLLYKTKENEGILLSAYEKNYFEHHFEKKILGKYDIVINIASNKLLIANMKEAEPIYYTLSNGKLAIRSTPTSDTDKIKEIFQLTSEERKELDRIVGEQIRDFDIS